MLLTLAVAVATPLLAFAGALLGQLLTRRSARELEVRWQREESMRLLRWAAERSSASDEGSRRIGLAALGALRRSRLVQRDDRYLLAAVAEAAFQVLVPVYASDEPVEEVAE